MENEKIKKSEHVVNKNQKNLIIIGIGRSGKTTLSNIVKERNPTINVIHSDYLKWAFIRAKNEEDFYHSNVEEQIKFESSLFFQKYLLEYFNFCIEKDYKKQGYVLESGQLEPKLITEMVDRKTTDVICLGLGNVSARDIVKMCREHDTEESWTFNISDSLLMEHAKNWVERNEKLVKECKEYKIPYFNTYVNRDNCLQDILSFINR